jgi:hypothetical protein
MEREHQNGRGHRDGQSRGARRANGARAGMAQAGSEAENSEHLQEASQPTPASGPIVPTATLEFDFEGSPVRTVVKDGQTWFVAADICAVLEHSNPTKAVLRLDEDERGLTTIQAHGGNDQAVNVVSESGLYNLIFTSRKPQAKVFRRWVTGEVLPSIRQTGRYEAASGVESGQLGGARGINVALPRLGRYVVTAMPGGKLHVHQIEFGTIFPEMTALDCQIMACALTTTAAFWHKVQQLRSIGVDPSGGFALEKLEQAILEGANLARHYLRNYEQRAAEATT